MQPTSQQARWPTGQLGRLALHIQRAGQPASQPAGIPTTQTSGATLHRHPWRRRLRIRRHPDLHSAGLVLEVVHALLDVLVDLIRYSQKSVLDPGAGARGGLGEEEAVAAGELLALLEGDFSLRVHVALVADEHHRDVGVAVLLRLVEPAADMFERTSICDVVAQNGACGSAVVRLRQGAELLEPGGVPDVQLDRLPVQVYDLGGKLNANGRLMLHAELLLRELQQEARLSDAGVADHDELEDVGAIRRHRPRAW
mmetsp:Transcript_24471/g.64579  ORF Transcript_24471/g.64579 Transcript_24471/m.64579 type:complete len:255 (+) Transcript_24471:163-927(+)